MRGMIGGAARCLLALSLSAAADDLRIQAFDGSGRLVFNRVSTATVYRVEWAPTPAGPWTNFTEAAASLDSIFSAGDGAVTCSVPGFYRVVAAVTNAAPPLPDGMVAISAGTNSGTAPDYGAYSLTVDDFYMEAREVTKGVWDTVYSWAVTNGYGISSTGRGKAANHPVHTVDWYSCVKWCNARSQMTGREPAYYTDAAFTQVYKSGDVAQPYDKPSANGYRLPTATQWQYAARGGLAGKRFPWGDEITHSLANYYSNSGDTFDVSPTRRYHPAYNDGIQPYTSPVASFEANAYGLFDMMGNVLEWCWDTTGYQGQTRVTVGGNWDSRAAFGQISDVGSNYPFIQHNSLGFRTVLPFVNQ